MVETFDRRKHIRIYDEAPVMYSDYIKNLHCYYGAKMLNRSAGGICLESTYSLRPGSVICIKRAYYAPDNLHVIAQTQDPDALKAEGRDSGALTYTFTDQGENIRRINDRGQDACSYFLPDGSGLIWTSTRDNMDMPIGNWSDSNDSPRK